MTLPPIHPNNLGSALEWALAAAGRFDEGTRLQHQAIERGYALYCPITGEYAWKGECDD